MKKVLFATTALIATASMAAADVNFSGYARFGLLYVDPDVGSDSTDITSRFRLQIDTSAEADNGLAVGARVRLQQNEGQSVATGSGGTNHARFYARSGGFEVGVGNIFGALEFMPGQYPIDIGLTGHSYDYTAYNFRGDAYSSAGNGSGGSNGVEIIYSAGDLGIHVSTSDTNDRIAGHFSYAFGDWTVALGLQDSDNAADTEVTASIGGTLGPVDLTLAWADNGTAGDHLVLAGRVDVGAATNVEAYVATADYADNGLAVDDESYGIDFNHNMGGGVSLRGGVSKNFQGATLADFGLRFNF